MSGKQNKNQFLALLRGINVGGNNIIAKDDLRRCFEQLGFDNVRTYIQSGNILFFTEETRVKELTESIEAGLAERFDYDAKAVVIPQRKYASAVRSAPDDWGADADRKHNAIFTMGDITPKKLMAQLDAPDPQLETVTIGPGVIFWSASKEQIVKTTIMKLGKSRLYRDVTVRNHNTVFKLLELFRGK